jgi:hypothetical protein
MLFSGYKMGNAIKTVRKGRFVLKEGHCAVLFEILPDLRGFVADNTVKHRYLKYLATANPRLN